MAFNVVDLYDKYMPYATDQRLVIFHQCSENLINYFNTSSILRIFFIDQNNVIVFEYDENLFISDHEFYNFILQKSREPLNSYSYIQSDGTNDMENITVLHNSNSAELNVYYCDEQEEDVVITSALTINGKTVPVSFHEQLRYNVSNKNIYNLMITCINDYLLENAFTNFGI